MPQLLYLVGMGKSWGMACRRAGCVALLGVLICVSPASAQESTEQAVTKPQVESEATRAANDSAAREYFEAGRAAFEQADYEGALLYFRHAYEMSGRAALQYNIGVAADRLQHEQEALDAFEFYLAETKQPTREAEVRGRIEALEQSLAEKEAAARALQEVSIRYEAIAKKERASDGARVPKSAIIGGSVLAAAGVAGVAAMSAGLAKSGTCTNEVAGQCVAENQATTWTYVYGGIGVAALAGSAVWFGVAAKRNKDARRTQVSISPTGVLVSGTF